MRKLLALAAVALFMITSCSDDDTTTTPIDNTLLQKMITTSEDGMVTTSNYNYDGNRIISMITSDGNSTIYTYTGNLITNVKTIQNNNITVETIIEYNSSNQKISEIILISGPDLGVAQGTKETYTYNQNGTITFNAYSGDLASQTTFEGTGTITFNENIIQHEGMDQETYKHVLDTKNNPMKNILGYNEYMKPHFDGNQNFVTAYTTPLRSVFIFTYTYNLNNYPVTSIEKVYQLNKYVTFQKQYFYE